MGIHKLKHCSRCQVSFERVESFKGMCYTCRAEYNRLYAQWRRGLGDHPSKKMRINAIEDELCKSLGYPKFVAR